MSHPDQQSQSLLLQPAPPEQQRHLLACVTVLDAQGRACFLYKAGVLLPAALSPAHMCMHPLQGWCQLCSRVFRGMLSGACSHVHCCLKSAVALFSALHTLQTHRGRERGKEREGERERERERESLRALLVSLERDFTRALCLHSAGFPDPVRQAAIASALSTLFRSAVLPQDSKACPERALPR